MRQDKAILLDIVNACQMIFQFTKRDDERSVYG